MTKQKQGHRNIPKTRLAIAVIIILLFTIAAITWILSAEHVISGIWSYALPVFFTVVPSILTLFQWLFPLSSSENERPLSSNVKLVDAALDPHESPYEQIIENGRTVIRYKGQKPKRISSD